MKPLHNLLLGLNRFLLYYTLWRYERFGLGRESNLGRIRDDPKNAIILIHRVLHPVNECLRRIGTGKLYMAYLPTLFTVKELNLKSFFTKKIPILPKLQKVRLWEAIAATHQRTALALKKLEVETTILGSLEHVNSDPAALSKSAPKNQIRRSCSRCSRVTWRWPWTHRA